MGARDVLTTISNWMSGLRQAVLANSLKRGVFAAIAGFVVVSLLLLTLEAVGHFSGTLRGVLLGVWGLSALAALGLGIVWPILRYTVFAPDDKRLAGEYAERIPAVKDRVLNALQLLDKVETAQQDGYSPDLILEAGRSVAEELKPIDPRALPDTRRVKFSQKLAIGAGALALLALAVFGGSLLRAGERVLKPGEEFAAPAPFTLTLKPGDAQLVRGDSLVVEIFATGEVPREVTLERQESGKNVSEPVALRFSETPPDPPVNGGGTDADSGRPGMGGSAAKVARYTYRGVTAPFTYWAHSGAVETDHYKVAVQELPSVKFLSVRLTPPAYTGLDEQILEENVGDIAALVGTQVKLSLAATKTLKSASLEFFTAKETPATPPANGGEAASASGHPGTDAAAVPTETRALVVDGSRANGEFAVRASGYYRIKLVDQDGRENRDPILYRVTARHDELPLITIIEPSQDLDIAGNVKLPLVAEAADDYGFTRMQLRYHRTSVFESPEQQQDEANYQSMALEYRQPEPGKAVSEQLWDLTPLDLLPEDQVFFFVEVWDNDRIAGPKRARSETRILRYPSMAEMFDQQEQQAEAQQISLEDLLKESKALREKVEEAVEEFKSNPELSWERKQELEKLMQQQSAMNELLEQVSEAMAQASQQMEQRALFSPEVMAKMEQIRKLAQEVITPEMREALKKLQEAMQQPSEEELRKAMENMRQNQDMFEQALDQTLNMLEQLKIEKKMDELTRRLDELGRQQEQLNEKLDQQSDAKQNSEEQKKLAEQMKQIEQELKQLAQQMQEKQMKAADQMEQMEKKSEEEQLAQQMKENSEQMQMGAQSMCKKKGKAHRRRMSEMANQLQNIKNQMNKDEDQEALEKLERTRDQLLDLSMRQEKLWKESEGLEAGSPQQAQAAEEQENLRQALSRVQEDLRELAKQSMHVSPKLMGMMSEAQALMMQASQAGSERDPRTASHYRRQSLAALNGALKENQNACSSCKNACNKPNPNSSCNKAGEMASQQQKLNQGTRQMMEGNQNPGSLSVGEQAGMQRLAVEQRELAKSAQQLSEEAKASQQSLGKLDDLSKDMEEVAKDLENRNVTQRTLEKQEQIENRLLDFQRANREREFSPMRQSNTGIDVVRASPAALPNKPGKDQLREDLLRALDAKYTPDYENLIRSYFEALSKWK